jgi:uncharacterized protein (DUF2252 family)
VDGSNDPLDQAGVTRRVAAGKEARRAAPRHAVLAYEPGAAGRRDPVEILREQAQNRVPELVPLRYARMLASPFAFYRGAAAIMASDLAASPASGLEVQLCGDAHLANFGMYASPERRLVFDINDFDETLPGPWEWDVKRLAASFEILGRHLNLPSAQRQAVVAAVAQGYRDAMAEFAALPALDMWRAQYDVDALLDLAERKGTRQRQRMLQANISKTLGRTSTQALAKLTEPTAQGPRIRNQPPVLERLVTLAAGRLTEAEALERVRALLVEYTATLAPDHARLLQEYEPVDAARKVVGVGSVGTRAFIILLLGRLHGDPLFLQVKEAQASVLEAALGVPGPPDHGERVVRGQRLMQTTSDPFLGWTQAPGIDGVTRSYYVRQLRDWKGSAELETFDAAAATAYAGICAWALAKGHARSGDRATMLGYLGSGRTFAKGLVAFSQAYGDQNEADYAELQAAAADGRIEVAPSIDG